MPKYEVKFLGTEGYEGIEGEWYGDCIIIFNESKKQMVVYDCGSEQHAEKVIEFMKDKQITQTDVLLSHNDRDHFDGILKLIEEKKVGKIFTTLFLKHVDAILEKLDDKRRTDKATKEHILDLYDNIAELSGNDLKDIYEDEGELPNGISFIGPDKDTMLELVAKAIKEDSITTTEGKETLVNAVSLQIAVSMQNDKSLLLVGDASVENIVCNLKDYWFIQLPHHGKLASAEAIFKKIENDEDDNIANHTFVISDNTGTSSGGSDDLMKSKVRIGKDIKNTKKDGTIGFGTSTYPSVEIARKNYGICSGI